MSPLIVHVYVRVKTGAETAFAAASQANASESLKEPGVVRFDVIQQQADPACFMLVEIYRDEAAAASHKNTPHYLTWRDTVAEMMAEPRRSVRYTNVFPEDTGW
jgi:autoinducer 2-degrading protein